MTRWYSAGWIWSNGENTDVNASLTHTSISPSSASVRDAASSTCVGVGHVDRQHERLAAGPLDVVRGGLEALLAAREQGHLGPAGAEGRGGGPADPAAGSGDHDDGCGHEGCSGLLGTAAGMGATRLCRSVRGRVCGNRAG